MHHRFLLAAAGIVGALGVAAAASASHATDSRNMLALAAICLSHGPALLALGLAGHSKALRYAGSVLAIGTLLFAADLVARERLGQGLFPAAAPIGGAAMILAWVGIAVAGLAGAKTNKFKKD
ncbi:DUF423 domain-containing protein [Devosia chinhatensis]|uniref:DUF423 domain-containing protein n=1 Tax=Devosia chinhatensis TaxID=429727 RepID=UPI001FCCD2C4|nr:DUF423 domain-containing protein [Devosia chinhatensis]